MRLGTDISHWQDDPNTPKLIDFNLMKSSGAEFVIFKVSQQQWTDQVFLNSWGRAKGILPRGAYFYMDNRVDGLTQAKYFLEQLKNDPPEGPYIVDFEDPLNINPASKPNGHLWNAVVYLLNETGRIPWIYTSPGYWMQWGSTSPGWTAYKLWIANYKVDKPRIPAPWNNAICWQFTAKGEGGIFGVESKGLDLNYFLGTDDEFRAEFGGESLPKPPLTMEERIEQLEECAREHNWCNI